MIRLKSCYKKFTQDLDKALEPAETIQWVKEKLAENGENILSRTERIDTGRLEIPVYMSFCGSKAKNILPTRKQMGKGASPEQAEASALMELVERYSLFSYWQNPNNFIYASWKEAKSKFQDQLIPVQEIISSVNENISEKEAISTLNLVTWHFAPAYNLNFNLVTYIPIDWFKKINEFNGSAAGNTYEEAILQGGCELVERHVCAIINNNRPSLPTINPNSFSDPVLIKMWKNFTRENIKVWLKDFSLDIGIPTVGALAYDPETFPTLSEIVFTAGTATSPDKAAIRALTEVAQLAGDFETGSNYEASGLNKYTSLQDCQWIQKGPQVPLNSLPNINSQDIQQELITLTRQLHKKGFTLYSIDIIEPNLGIPACYNIVPGFQFRERTDQTSLGLFVGRTLAEESPIQEAEEGLETLEKIYPKKYFIPFFKGLLLLRKGRPEEALHLFTLAEPLQPSSEEQSLVAFYRAYALTLLEKWPQAIPDLDRAIQLGSDNNIYYNLRGVAYFKLNKFELAVRDFQKALDINSGSAIDLANIGLCYKFMDKPQSAIKFLKSSLRLDPSLEFARNHLLELQSNSS